jgi:uncharacterized lipoprotein YmbA
MPKTRIYSLHLPAENAAVLPRKQVIVTLRVQSPRYLAQPYIAWRNSPYQLEISGYAKWELPPVDMTREIFRDALIVHFQQVRVSNAVSDGSVVLSINLRRFEGADDQFGELVLDAEVSTAEGKEIHRMTVSRKVLLDTKDSDGLAKALSSALHEAVQEVVAAMESRV